MNRLNPLSHTTETLMLEGRGGGEGATAGYNCGRDSDNQRIIVNYESPVKQKRLRESATFVKLHIITPIITSMLRAERGSGGPAGVKDVPLPVNAGSGLTGLQLRVWLLFFSTAS